MFEVALSLSIAGLLIGPLLTSWARGRASALATLDAAMLGVVLPLLLLRLVPHLIDEIGPIAVAAVITGYAVFMVVESRTHARATRLGVAILLPTLAVHSFLDGTALAVAFERGVATATGSTLATALVLHRFPEGLVLASALIPTLGLRGTMLRVSVLAGLTVIGALVGRELLAHTPDRALHLVVAAGIGVMLGMILHRHRDTDAVGHKAWRDGVVFLVFAAVSITIPGLWQVLEYNQPHELSAAQAIGPLFIATSPWILGALLLGELAVRVATRGEAVPPPRQAAWLAVLVLATVWLGPMFAAVVLSLGLAIGIWNRAVGAPTSWSAMLAAIVPCAAAVLPSYTVGVAIALTLEAAVPAGAFGALGLAEVPFAAVASTLLRIGTVGALPIAAIVVHKGASPGAGLAFVLIEIIRCSAPRSLVSWRSLLAIVAVCAVAMVMMPVLGAEPPPLHELVGQLPSAAASASATLLAAWTIIELAHRGPRHFFDEIH